MEQTLPRMGHGGPVGEAVAGAPGTAADGNAPSPGGSAEAARWSGPHPVNIRLSVPLPLFGRCYLTVVAGRERRSAERRAGERRKHPLLTYGNIAFFFAVGCVIGLAVLALLQLAVLTVLERSGSLMPPA